MAKKKAVRKKAVRKNAAAKRPCDKKKYDKAKKTGYKRNPAIDRGHRKKMYKLALSGLTSTEIHEMYPQYTFRQIRQCVQDSRGHFEREKFKMGREALSGLVMQEEVVFQELLKDFLEAANDVTETIERINRNGEVEIVTKTYRKDRSTMANSLAKQIELKAKLLGVFNPDFDAQEGAEIKIINVAVNSEADIAKFETLGRRGDVDGFSEKIVEQEKLIEAQHHRIEDKEADEESDGNEA